MKTRKRLEQKSRKKILQQLLTYGVLTVILAAGFSLLISGLSLLLGSSIRANNPFLIGVIVFALVFLFNPLRFWIQDLIDRIFDRSQVLYRERLQSLNRDLTRSMKMQEIINLLRQYIEDSLVPYTVHIYLYNNPTDQYWASSGKDQKPTSDLRFEFNDPLPQYLIKTGKCFVIKDPHTLPDELKPVQSRLALLGAVLFVPLPGQHKLTGWLALLPRQSGLPYTHREIRYLESLAEQSAMAIERAQVIVDLERRVHEMNVLTRFSQGINVTMTFDDTLELIYAHTNLLIPTRDFFITLYDESSDTLYHAFYLENDERLSQHENQPIPYGKGLEREIIKSRHPIATFDYERECRNRGTLPDIHNVFSWIGVPLNAGAETIGTLSLGSRDTGVVYTDGQANLLLAIADQAAGAIVKTRLLQEAERRTTQLTTLNDVARSLSSTLALKPLLHEILKGAIEIVNCEAGSLFIVDQQTQELVLEAVMGNEDSELLGQRFPIHRSWEGKAILAQKALIFNDAVSDLDWGEEEAPREISYRNLLVVPMIVNDEVTGVIRAANRREEVPFSSDDQELLTAFTSQAAVALENARLYTITDQTLADRVEELSVMQQIDQELNASLDVNRAMRITLEWAMRQSQAPAGLIGITADDGVHVIASKGYAQELEYLADETIPISFKPFQRAFETRQPQFIQLTEQDKDAILAGATSQIIIPIRREEVVIGILLLENNQAGSYSEETLAFLSRLSDHAAIAIANARLYTEVQAANQAKNDFISFISHELKTPMTSIRGFSDLLASEMVGPINENQSNFLGTIRSNVDRMATLVSDLTDVSRIEAGRIRLEFTAVPVSEVVDEVVRSVRTQLMEKEQKLEVMVPVDLPAMWGDRVRLIQIITNLVSNAHKYSPSGGLITVQAELIDESVAQGTRKVIHLSVKDNGYGITPEHQKFIFQKFYRSDDQKVRDTPGTGLGLNISKQLVELLGGHIWFESIYRAGTTFHITIPIAEIQ